MRKISAIPLVSRKEIAAGEIPKEHDKELEGAYIEEKKKARRARGEGGFIWSKGHSL